MSAVGGVYKQINKYLQQAKKLDKIEPVIAYYCRFYAALHGMKIRQTKADTEVVTALVAWCEKHKSIVEGLSKEDARSLVESFALQVFAAADNEDRTGNATQQTAHQFYSAYVFMDVCRQWGELASDLEQKIKYAMWKATDINKAIKEGRQPKPGGVDEDDGFGMGDGMGGGGGAGGGGGGGSGNGSEKALAGVGGDGASVGGFVPGGGSGDNEDEQMSQLFHSFSMTQQPTVKDEPMEEEKAPVERTQYAPSDTSSSLPTSYLPSIRPSSSYPDMPPPVPPQPPLSPNTASSLGFAPSSQPFSPSGLSPGYSAGYSPGFLGPAIPPHASPSSQSPPPTSVPSPSPPPPPSSTRPHLPAPSGRRPGSVGPPPASEYSSSSRYSPALPSQITPSALPPVAGKSRTTAMKEAERLMKHAGSALSFDDVDTAIVKMQQAVALLYNHRTVQKSDQDM